MCVKRTNRFIKWYYFRINRSVQNNASKVFAGFVHPCAASRPNQIRTSTHRLGRIVGKVFMQIQQMIGWNGCCGSIIDVVNLQYKLSETKCRRIWMETKKKNYCQRLTVISESSMISTIFARCHWSWKIAAQINPTLRQFFGIRNSFTSQWRYVKLKIVY